MVTKSQHALLIDFAVEALHACFVMYHAFIDRYPALYSEYFTLSFDG